MKVNLYKSLTKSSLTKLEEVGFELSAPLLLPPYHLLNKLGIVLYTGNHLIRKDKEIVLVRFGSS